MDTYHLPPAESSNHELLYMSLQRKRRKVEV